MTDHARAPMHVVLSFDIEIWCGGWRDLDARFPASFDRYVYGRSAKGEYALPMTLEIVRRHGLVGTFFVEPLFSGRFGRRYLKIVVDMIQEAGQDVQLHLHPEWTDEIRPPLLAAADRKRQFMCYYTHEEQRDLIAWGKAAVEDCSGRPVTAFRAGGYAANRNTLHALRDNGIFIDSSLNVVRDVSGGDLPSDPAFRSVTMIDGVAEYHMTVFRDGFGRLRPAQVGACSFAEIKQAIEAAYSSGCRAFVINSHNFELLRDGRMEPDPIVVDRFQQLCAWLAAQRGRIDVRPYPRTLAEVQFTAADETRPRASAMATARRHLEQAVRRLW